MKHESTKRAAQELKNADILNSEMQFAKSKKNKHHEVPCNPDEHTRSKDELGRRVRKETTDQDVTQIPGTRP